MEPASSPSSIPDGFRKWWIALTLFLGTLSVGLSVTAVNIAIPTMMSSFGVSLNRIQWVLTGFMITRTVLIPCVGWLGDRIGDRLRIDALGLRQLGSELFERLQVVGGFTEEREYEITDWHCDCTPTCEGDERIRLSCCD
jgi:hypothetical protein